MSVTIEEFAAFLGWEVDDAELKRFEKTVKSATDAVKKVAKAVTVAASAMAAATVITNKQTAEMANLAKTVGVSTDFLIAMKDAVSEIGLNMDNVVDMVEELNNKMGESKNVKIMTAVKEATKGLGLEYKALAKLDPSQQILKILDAAKELDDHQQAVSAVDQLMGAESNKVVGFLRTLDGSLSDIIQSRLRMNMLNQEGIDGAVKFTNAWTGVRRVLGSAMQQIAGLVGKGLTPLLERFTDWAAKNKEVIQTKISEWAEDFVEIMKTMVGWAKTLVQWTGIVVDKMGGWKTLFQILTTVVKTFLGLKLVFMFRSLVTVLKQAAVAQKLLNALALANPYILLTLAIGLLILMIDDYIGYTKGMDSATADVGESMMSSIEKFTAFASEKLGLTEKEFKQIFKNTADIFVGIFTDIGAWFGRVWDGMWLSAVTTINKIKTFGATMYTAFKGIGTGIWNLFSAIFSGIVSLLSVAIGKITQQIQGLLKWVAGMIRQYITPVLSKIPGLQDTAAGLSRGLDQYISTPGSPQVVGDEPWHAVGAGGSTVNSVQVSAPMNIVQAAGENSEAFARRVADILESKMGDAVSLATAGQS